MQEAGGLGSRVSDFFPNSGVVWGTGSLSNCRGVVRLSQFSRGLGLCLLASFSAIKLLLHRTEMRSLYPMHDSTASRGVRAHISENGVSSVS